MNIGESLPRNAQHFPDKPAIVDDGLSVNAAYGELVGALRISLKAAVRGDSRCSPTCAESVSSSVSGSLRK
jgi:hypothetical protein